MSIDTPNNASRVAVGRAFESARHLVEQAFTVLDVVAPSELLKYEVDRTRTVLKFMHDHLAKVATASRQNN